MSRLRTEERQTQIIDEAIKIIHEQGYSSLAIRELAKRVGISEPAIYRHFTNKEEIIAGILDRVLNMNNMLRPNLSTLSSPREKIRRFILFHFEFLSKNREITSVIFSENIFESKSVLKAKLHTILTSRRQMLKTLLEEARLAGDVVDADEDDLAVLILGNIRLIIMQWRLADFNFDLKKRGDRMLATLEKLIFT